MAKYKVGQSILLRAQTSDANLGSALVAQLWILDPNNDQSQIDADVVETSILEYTFTPTETGTHKVVAYWTHSGGIVNISDEPLILQVKGVFE